MPASVAATSPALEMVSCGEDDVSVGIVITIFFAAGRTRILEQCQNFAFPRFGIFLLVPKLRHGLKTRPAEARRLEAICGESAKDLTRDDDLLTPARSLVKMTFCHAASVVATAHRALFIPAQALHPIQGG